MQVVDTLKNTARGSVCGVGGVPRQFGVQVVRMVRNQGRLFGAGFGRED